MKNLQILSAVALAAALFFPAHPLRAQRMDLQHARAQKDLTPAVQQSLQDKLSDVTGPYFDEQDENKANGKVYIDLLQKFEYLPTYGPHNHLVVSCKLGGVEYNPVKKGTTKGLATGNLKYLVFTYALENGQWVSVTKPKWETQNLGAAGTAQMRQNLARGEQRKATMEKTAQTHAAAAAAAAAAQRAADRGGQ
jgi:hypothetical protein